MRSVTASCRGDHAPLDRGGKYPLTLAFTQTPLLVPGDLPWLIEQCENGNSAANKTSGLRLFEVSFRIGHPGHVDALLEAIRSYPALKTAFGPLFAPVEIDSPQADAMRATYRKEQEWQERLRVQRRPLQPPPQERIAIHLNRMEAGNLDAWWVLNL